MASTTSSTGFFTKTCDRFLSRKNQAELEAFIECLGEAGCHIGHGDDPCECAFCIAEREDEKNDGGDEGDDDDDVSIYQSTGSCDDIYDRNFYDEDAEEAYVNDSTSSCWPEPLRTPVPAVAEYADLAESSPYDTESDDECQAAADEAILGRRVQAGLNIGFPASWYADEPPKPAAAALPKSKHHHQRAKGDGVLTRKQALAAFMRHLNREQKMSVATSVAQWISTVDGDENAPDDWEEAYAYDYDFARYHDDGASSPSVPEPLFSPRNEDWEEVSKSELD